MIVHVDGREMLERVAVVPAGDEGRVVAKLMEAFWPGPLTLLLPRTAAVPDAVTAGRALVGVRMPAHPVALELIRLAGVPVPRRAPTASGNKPTTAAHVLAVWTGGSSRCWMAGRRVLGGIDRAGCGGACDLPAGAVTAAMIAEAIGEEVRVVSGW